MSILFEYDYLIAGGSLAADSAIKAIRKEDENGSIGLLCDEPFPPYRRPALSKHLWQDDDRSRIWLETERHDVDIMLSTKAVGLDPQNKTLTDNYGVEYTFNKLLIATGASPRKMNPSCGDVHYFRNLSNFETIRSASEYAREIVILGGGFIGFELAACLNESGKSVTMIFPEELLGSLIFPAELSRFLHDYYTGKGVKILSDDVPEAVIESHGRRSITTRNGKRLEADMVIASVGCIPNSDIAMNAGLQVDNGIVVDENLNCGHPDIFAAGDVANFHSLALNRRMRIEHADNAVMMGRHAGLSMLGHKDVYGHIPSFYADMFDQNLKAVGMIRSDMDIRAEWNVPLKEGTLYYSRENRISGVLYWNMPAKLDAARSLIAEDANLI